MNLLNLFTEIKFIYREFQIGRHNQKYPIEKNGDL